jgi:hypothetical protein
LRQRRENPGDGWRCAAAAAVRGGDNGAGGGACGFQVTRCGWCAVGAEPSPAASAAGGAGNADQDECDLQC